MYEELRSEFRNLFTNKEEIEWEFSLEKGSLENTHIIFAHYENDDCSGYDSGYAYVLFAENDQLFEIHGSHCSCHGLEDQWDPEPVTLEFLRSRLSDNSALYLGFTLEEYTKVCDQIEGIQASDNTNNPIQ